MVWQGVSIISHWACYYGFLSADIYKSLTRVANSIRSWTHEHLSLVRYSVTELQGNQRQIQISVKVKLLTFKTVRWTNKQMAYSFKVLVGAAAGACTGWSVWTVECFFSFQWSSRFYWIRLTLFVSVTCFQEAVKSAAVLQIMEAGKFIWMTKMEELLLTK